MSVELNTKYQPSLVNIIPRFYTYADLMVNNINNSKVNFLGANAVKLVNITTGGSKAHDKDSMGSAFASGSGWSTSSQTLTLACDRAYPAFVDESYANLTSNLAIAQNVLSTFETTTKPYEYSCEYSSKIYSIAKTNSNVDHTVPSKSNVWDIIQAGEDKITNSRAIYTLKLAYMTPAMMSLIKTSDKNNRFVQNRDGILNNMVTYIDDFKCIVVPADELKTLYTKANGYVIDATAKQINLIMIGKEATVTPSIIDHVLLDGPTSLSEGKSTLYYHYFYDLFILDAYKDAMFVNAEAEA